MLTWFRSLFAWRTVRTINHGRYQENAVTGARRFKAVDLGPGRPAAPPDEGWLYEGRPFGEWRRLHPPPPICD